MLSEDYKDRLHAFCAENVKFLLVGAYAIAVHGYPRVTMEIEIWVISCLENADADLRALRRFGTPSYNLAKQDLLQDGTSFQMGFAPRQIDIITSASGLQFDHAYRDSIVMNIEGIDVHIPSIEDLIVNNKATGRTKDLADAEAPESLKDAGTGLA